MSEHSNKQEKKQDHTRYENKKHEHKSHDKKHEKKPEQDTNSTKKCCGEKKACSGKKWPDLKNTIQVCNGKACGGRFSEYIKTRLESDKTFYNLPKVDVVNCPCTGNCKVWPSVIFGNEEVSIYMDPARASQAMVDMFKKKKSTSTKKAIKGKWY